MDVRTLKKAFGIGLLTAAAITNTTAQAADATVQVDVNLPTVLVMYHYNTITLDLDQAALAGYLVGGTAVACAGGVDWCDDQLNPPNIPVTTITGTDTITQNVADVAPAATTTSFTMQGVVGVRAFGCATYDTTVTDGGSDTGVTVQTAGGIAGIQGSACSFSMTRGDLSFDLDFDVLDATSSTASAVFDVTITGA